MRRKARPSGSSPRCVIVGLLLALEAGGGPCLLSIPGVAASPAAKRVDVEPSSLAVVIDAPGPTVDAGVPFTLTANLGDGLAPFGYLWSCPLVGFANTASWTVDLGSAGEAARFTLEVFDADEQVAWTNLTLNVTTAPSVTASSVNASADAGTPVGLHVDASGGVPPYSLGWTLTGNGSSGSAILPSPGAYSEAVWTNATGPAWAGVTLVDALGGRASAATWVTTEFAYPNVSLALSPAWAEAGQPFHLLVAVAGGTPPIVWSVGAIAPLLSGSASQGTLDRSGDIAWNATIEIVGNFTVWFTARDAVGVDLEAAVTVSVIPPVNASLAILNASPTAGAPLALGGLIGGGVGPFDYDWTLSDGERAAGNLSSAGPINWTASPSSPGYLSILLTVRDAAGGTAQEVRTVLVLPGPPPSSPPPGTTALDSLPWTLGALLGVSVAALAGWVWVRRRRRPVTDDHDGPVRTEVVARLLEENGEVDIETLEYLADGEGLDPPEVRRAVEALVTDGRVRRENSADGDRLFWVDPTGPAPAAFPETRSEVEG
ncbi:MAG: hypothetical protein L3K17_03445 [Thermoplasmata archaeon]|nr:hypothetical protein [Thermoplasmata archaeon]